MGAWIETYKSGPKNDYKAVAPRVGAWIETLIRPMINELIFVAPRVGAWIETFCWDSTGIARKSRPVWARGLKHQRNGCYYWRCYVAPRVGAWIETIKGIETI